MFLPLRARARLRTFCSTSTTAATRGGKWATTLQDFQKQFPFHVSIGVEYRDLDAMHHVNNAVYFQYFETARIRHFSSFLHGERFDFTPHGISPVISDTAARFRRPIGMYDQLCVGVGVSGINRERGEFKHIYQVFSADLATVACVGEATVVTCDFERGGVRAPIPEKWLGTLLAPNLSTQ